jgi:hypothetical protein
MCRRVVGAVSRDHAAGVDVSLDCGEAFHRGGRQRGVDARLPLGESHQRSPACPRRQRVEQLIEACLDGLVELWGDGDAECVEHVGLSHVGQCAVIGGGCRDCAAEVAEFDKDQREVGCRAGELDDRVHRRFVEGGEQRPAESQRFDPKRLARHSRLP